MRPSSRRSSSPGAYFGLAFLVVVLIPLALFKFLGGMIAPDLVDSVTQYVKSFVAGLSSSMVGGVKDAFLALVVAAVVIYMGCLVHSVMRGSKSEAGTAKSRRVA